MPTTYGKVSGTFQTITDPQAKVFGSWVPVNFIYAKVSGVWQLVFTRGFTFNDTISISRQNYNLSTAAIAGGWNGTDALLATVTINSGIIVGSSSTGTYGFTVPSLPAGSTVSIMNSGYIVGHGGNGGTISAGIGTDGSPGGPALSVAFAITINNVFGLIGGGGGGGGTRDFDDPIQPQYGGGGAGNTIGSQSGTDGGIATTVTGGIGFGGGQAGPTGGDIGQAGQDSDHIGGAAGLAISGYSNITWSGGAVNIYGATSG